ncbi:50S ribosomal protein L2 [Candidatus Vidania fulgoroideorum]
MIKNKPTSPGVRHKIKNKKSFNFYRKIKNLIFINKKNSGRNNQGKITTRHKGGGVKKKYRLIDFKRNKYYVSSVIKNIEYDPNRNVEISLLCYKDGEYKYIIYIKDTRIGDIILSGIKTEISLGNAMILKNIPKGIKICCIEISPGKGAKLCRSAGTFSKIISKKGDFCVIKLKSGEIRKINSKCMATIGEIGNSNFYLQKIGKAGTNRLKGKRPTVRGVAMNPIDHPHGGGEGKTSTKRNPVSKWGKLTKGFKTKKNKRFLKMILKNV